MIEDKVERKLRAILSADVKGYSRMMGEDEVGTFQTLTANLESIRSIISKNKGRIFSSPGDAVVAEFSSAVYAVKSAVELQEKIEATNTRLPENRKMKFRIGVNLGDVIHDGEQVYGDGVNITSRIEGLAEGGGICISENIYDQVKNKLNLSYEYMGEHAVKHIPEPVRVYNVKTSLKPEVYHPDDNIKLPEKPSIAVLPFTNMSGDTEQEYFSDGITEDLITDLSKISSLFVIARNSVFTYKGKAVNVTEVGSALGVNYILEGSVRKAGNRVRISAQLVDATNGGHIWAERYDRDFQNIFALQDEVTKKIVSILAVKLTEGEQKRRACKCKTTCNTVAYDYYLRGHDQFYKFTIETNYQARKMYERAVEIDPRYALAYSMHGSTYLIEWNLGWSQDRGTLEKAFELAERALSLDDTLPEPHELLGNIYLWQKQHDRAIGEFRRAISLDPNNADWLAGLGGVLVWADRPEEAIELIYQAMRLNPMYPQIYLWNLGNAYLVTKKYKKAIKTLKKSLDRNPDFWPSHILLAVSYSAIGQIEDARAEAAETKRLNPSFSIESWRYKCPLKNPDELNQRLDNLRKAGFK